MRDRGPSKQVLLAATSWAGAEGGRAARAEEFRLQPAALPTATYCTRVPVRCRVPLNLMYRGKLLMEKLPVTALSE
jgi:hypothetical protein